MWVTLCITMGKLSTGLINIGFLLDQSLFDQLF
ncbi:MAG: hypothetical protein ACI823_002236 [Chitinophagales bacterium]